MKLERVYRESSLLCFTETWLNQDTPDSVVSLTGFTFVRADRSAEESGKKKGGGLAVFVNDRWCNPGHVNVKVKLCSRDIELLAVSVRPYYIPREFSHVLVLTVYIPPSANAAAACECVHSTVSKLQTEHPQALIVISGDFNHVSLSATLTSFIQYVNCHTRDKKTLDLLYANIKNAYISTPLPPLGRSDHNLVHLLPAYTPVVKQQSPQVKEVKIWSEEASERLRDCFNITDWDVLCSPHGEDIDSLTHCVTDYINFCVENTVPSRSVQCFPNNKPWVTPELKALLNEKKRAFLSGDREELRRVQRELKYNIRRCKDNYKKKLERGLEQNNIRDVWRGLKYISGHGKHGDALQVIGDQAWANELNLFFNRFNSTRPSAPSPHLTRPAISSQLLPLTSQLLPQYSALPPTVTECFHQPSASVQSTPNPLCLTLDQVRRELKKTKARKATGPDNINSRVLRECADQLCEVVLFMFNLSLSLERVPALWKTSCVVPVPKISHPKELNHYRPVALTSHLMKAMERIVLSYLRNQVSSVLDPLQFAYRSGIGVDDAIIYLLHRALSYLEAPGCTVRVMFFDFSSAFNTIQPTLLRGKMEEAGVDQHLAAWIINYLTDRPQFVRLRDCVSDVVVCSTGAPQGTVLSPFLFTLYTSDFKYNSFHCHLQKFSDDTAIVGCVSGENEQEYRGVISDFVCWCEENHLLLNTSKTKEMVLDFRRNPPSHIPVCIQGLDIEIVDTFKYLGVHLNNKLDWSTNTDALYRKGQSRLHLLRRLRSFGVCRELLRTFYDTVVASVVLYSIVCWAGSSSDRDRKRLNKLVKRAGSVLGCTLDTIEEVAERRMLVKLSSIMDNPSHPMHHTVEALSSSFSTRLLHPQCKKERYRQSFLPTAIRLYNISLK
ncbi:uncharacterized protein [Garra rufa]|uniref:uncharacterized protein n=1 Tax=Garra rufa TaxID=137080 RepID=UPI003CCE8946